MLRYVLGLILLVWGGLRLNHGMQGHASGLLFALNLPEASYSFGYGAATVLELLSGILLVCGIRVRAACLLALPAILDELARALQTGAPLYQHRILMLVLLLHPLVLLTARAAQQWYEQEAGYAEP